MSKSTNKRPQLSNAFRTLLDEMRWANGKDPETRKVRNNTYLVRVDCTDEPEDSAIEVVLHGSTIATVYASGTIDLSTCGWDTVTTRKRLNWTLGKVAPGFRVWTEGPRYGKCAHLFRYDPEKVVTRKRRHYVYRYPFAPFVSACSCLAHPDTTDEFHAMSWTEQRQWVAEHPGTHAGQWINGRREYRGQVEETSTGNWTDLGDIGYGLTFRPDDDGRKRRRGPDDGPEVRRLPVVGPDVPLYKVLRHGVGGRLEAPVVHGYEWRRRRRVKVTGPLVPCASGLHCCTAEQVRNWATVTDLESGAVSVFTARAYGPVYNAGEKCVARELCIGERVPYFRAFFGIDSRGRRGDALPDYPWGPEPRYAVQNGSHGCLPDNYEGPFETIADAVEYACDLFADYLEGDPETETDAQAETRAETFRRELADGWRYEFPDGSGAGADYVALNVWTDPTDGDDGTR